MCFYCKNELIFIKFLYIFAHLNITQESVLKYKSVPLSPQLMSTCPVMLGGLRMPCQLVGLFAGWFLDWFVLAGADLL